MKITEKKLLDRLKKEFGIDISKEEFYYNKLSKSDKSAGAVIWGLLYSNIGSECSVSECVKANKISLNKDSITGMFILDCE